MGQAIAVRTDYTAGEVRRFAKQAKDVAQARRLLAIAAVLEGTSRADAAKIGGMDRQTLRDWVIRFNDQGRDSLINIPSPGVPPKLNAMHRAFLAKIVEEGPIPAAHGVVRWRACDLIMRVHEEFGISVSYGTIYRTLKDLGFSHLSARPKAYKQDPEAVEAFKKLLCTRGGSPREARARYTGRSVVPGRNAGRAEEQAHLPLGSEGLTSPRRARSAHPIDLPVRRSLPRPRSRCSPRATGLIAKPCSFISTRSPPRLHRAPMPFSFSIKPAGTALRNFGFRPTFPYCRCRRAHPSSTAKRTSGSSCVRTGCQTGYSNRLTTSSITAATPGTHLLGNRGRSCPSPDATGRPSVTHCDD